ncbi:hypothetical protein [Streptomyces sp. NBC_01089]|uniref:hypothetical protein n=1 Tax=Streptomyces sp. NBC_01089 TaxID=2903747 RepID=UPI0038687EA2
MRVLLVNMPWAPIEVPSLALGILKNRVAKTMPETEIDVIHANLDFADWITERVDFRGRDYYYSLVSYFKGCGDWVFSSALYDDPKWRLAEFQEQLGNSMTEAEMKLSVQLHSLVPQFIEHIAEHIAGLLPDVVGFTSTFQQNAAALAAAKRIKELAPGVATVFGGANCDGEQGAALHRNFDFQAVSHSVDTGNLLDTVVSIAGSISCVIGREDGSHGTAFQDFRLPPYQFGLLSCKQRLHG